MPLLANKVRPSLHAVQADAEPATMQELPEAQLEAQPGVHTAFPSDLHVATPITVVPALQVGVHEAPLAMFVPPAAQSVTVQGVGVGVAFFVQVAAVPCQVPTLAPEVGQVYEPPDRV